MSASAFLDPQFSDALVESRIVLTPPSHHEIVITRVLNAPRELVFAAWTQPEHIKRWWGPDGFQGMVCEVDLRVGGHFNLNLRGPDGIDYPCEGTYHEIVPNERIVYSGMTDDRHPCGCGIPPHSLVTVHFVEHGAGKTRLTINARVNSGMCDAIVQGGFVPGWSQATARLDSYLAGA
ncbi:MAG: SRPBCC domain-containing protein [Moraxellaceae bacterium]|nr:SRPBCC domain-containing protein [Moraxellaceae bacterium]